MLLAVDIGNTNIGLAVFDGEEIVKKIKTFLSLLTSKE